MSKQTKKSVATQAQDFGTMVQALTVQPSTPVITEGKVVSSQVSKPVAKEIALLDKDVSIAKDTIPSLVSNWDVFQKKAVEDALKLAHRIGRIMFHVGYDKLDETVDTFKKEIKTHFQTDIDKHVAEHGIKKWSQTPSYKNALKPIAEGREWVFPKIKTALQIAEDATKKASKEKEKQAAHVEALSLGDEGQAAISGCRLMVKRMIESAYSVDGRIVMTDAKQANMERDCFQMLSNFLTDEKLQANRTTKQTETGLVSITK